MSKLSDYFRFSTSNNDAKRFGGMDQIPIYNSIQGLQDQIATAELKMFLVHVQRYNPKANKLSQYLTPEQLDKYLVFYYFGNLNLASNGFYFLIRKDFLGSVELNRPPQNLLECYLSGKCTFNLTNRDHLEQEWYQSKADPLIGVCLVCYHLHLDQSARQLIKGVQVTGRFYCDFGAQELDLGISYPPMDPVPSVDESSTEQVFSVDDSLRFDPKSYQFTTHMNNDALTCQGKYKIIYSDVNAPTHYKEKPYQPNYFTHQNFIRYLELCWDTHAGMVVSPDIFWFVITGQLAQHIKQNAETYREIFTTSRDKQELVIVVPDPRNLDISILITQLRKVIPGNADQIVDAFLPSFSTSTPLSREATASNFCEAMESYYSYSTSMCGVKKVKILGTPADYRRLSEHCRRLTKILTLPACVYYLTTLARRFERIWDPEIWKNFFAVAHCGSGHDVTHGWVTELYALTAKTKFAWTSYQGGNIYGGRIKDFTDGSQVNYVNQHNGVKYRKCYGILTCQLVDDFLHPNFNHVILEDITSPPPPAGQEKTGVPQPSSTKKKHKVKKKKKLTEIFQNYED